MCFIQFKLIMIMDVAYIIITIIDMIWLYNNNIHVQ